MTTGSICLDGETFNCCFISLFAYWTFQRSIQFLAALTHPADLPGRVANHQGIVGDIFRNYCSGADKSIGTDSVAADDCAVGAQGGALFDKRGAHLIHPADFRSWVIDVGKNHRRSAEYSVFEGDTFIDADVVLDFAFVANGCVGADDNILTDVTILANFGAGENV